MTTGRPPAPAGRAFWLGTLLGAAVMAFGIAGLLVNADETKPGSWLKWLLGGLIAHDLLLAPAVIALGAVAARVVPPAVRPVLVGTAFVAGSLVLVSVPALLGRGRDATEPSLLPHDYGGNLLAALGVVAALGLAFAVWHGVRLRRRAHRRVVRRREALRR